MKNINKIGAALFSGCILLMASSCADEKMELEATSEISTKLATFTHTSNNYNFAVNLSVKSDNDKIEIEGNQVQYVFTDASGKEIVSETVSVSGNPSTADGILTYPSKCTLSEYNFNHDTAKLTVKARVRAVTEDGYESEWYNYASQAIELTGLRPFADLGLSVMWSTDDLTDSNGETLSAWATTNDMTGMPDNISATNYDPALYDLGNYVGVRRTPTLYEYLELLDENNCDWTTVITDGSDYAYSTFTSKKTGQSVSFKISVASGAKTQYWTATFDQGTGLPVALEFEAVGSSINIRTIECDPSMKLHRHTVLNSTN